MGIELRREQIYCIYVICMLYAYLQTCLCAVQRASANNRIWGRQHYFALQIKYRIIHYTHANIQFNIDTLSNNIITYLLHLIVQAIMKRIRPQVLIDSILKRAPHRVHHRMALISHGQQTKTQNMQQLDKDYLELFVYHTQCDYLLERHFRIKDLMQMQPSQRGPIYVDKKNQKQTRPLTQKNLLAAIKKLNDHKYAYNTYLEAEETVIMMTPEEALKHKRYLVYIYKWILNQRTWPNQDIQHMGAQLKKVVVGKIYQGHENNEEKEKAKEELEKIELKINEKMEIQKQKEKEKIDKIITSYKEKTQACKNADKNKQ